MKLQYDAKRPLPLRQDHLDISDVKSDLGITSLYFTKAGKPWLPVLGEFQYSRYDREDWEKELLKLRAGGVDVVQTYCFWLHHEENEGEFCFEGDRDLRAFMALCEKHQIPVLLRIGPFVHGEAKWGGLPEFIQNRKDKRTNSPEYLAYVERLWKKYYEQVKDYFYQDGSVLIGIQLENEYSGPQEHIAKLKELAIKAGFRVPLYTVTGWPGSFPKGIVLPLFGTYPEAPWHWNTRPLRPLYKFAILPGRCDMEVGSDSLPGVLMKREEEFLDYPYGTCEQGGGNQITERRRPIISPMDVYAMSLIGLAKGVNCIGYYVYHGGRNPSGGEYHESKKTGYPNNLPVLSYDFQAPLTEYGYDRPSFHYLNLLHMFTRDFGAEAAPMQAAFSTPATDNMYDFVTPRTSVRVDENGAGLAFFNTYQRLHPIAPIQDLEGEVETPNGVIPLPKISVGQNTSFFYPFGMTFGGCRFRYLTAQPLSHFEKEGKDIYVFMKEPSVPCRFVMEAEPEAMVTEAEETGGVYEVGHFTNRTPILSYQNGKTPVEIYLLDKRQSLRAYRIENKVFSGMMFTDDLLYYDDTEFHLIHKGNGDAQVEAFGQWKDETARQGFCPLLSYADYQPEAELFLKLPRKLPYDEWLYSKKRCKVFELTMPKDLFEHCDDCAVSLNIHGNVVHMYAGTELRAEYMNYDGDCVVYCKRFRDVIEAGEPIVLKISPLSRWHKIYFEMPMLKGQIDLTVREITPIYEESLSHPKQWPELPIEEEEPAPPEPENDDWIS